MTSLYRKNVAPNTSSPYMQVAASQGAAGGIPRGASASMPQNGQSLDASQLGGLLGMIRNIASPGSTGEGVFNSSVMPGVGQSLALGGGTSLPASGVLGSGIPTDGMSLNFDPSSISNILGGMGFGA